MPRFEDIEGQERALSALRGALSNERLASTYLFTGPSGVGKELSAKALATEVVAGNDSSLRTRIEAEQHPDVRIFGPREEGKHNIQVEFLRSEILPLTHYAPFEAERAFFIFPDADVSFPSTHPESANALLKTLEEPKANIHFILISSKPSRLLSTIRSRCQQVRFDTLTPQIIERVLQKSGVPETERKAAAALSEGRCDRALILADQGIAKELIASALRTHDAIQSKAPSAILKAAEEIAKHERRDLVLETLQRMYRDISCLALGMGSERLMLSHIEGEIALRTEELKADNAAERVREIAAYTTSLEYNANPQIGAEALLFRLAGQG